MNRENLGYLIAGFAFFVMMSRNRKQFTFMIQSLGFDEDKFLNEYYNSPTEAYEAAIEYTLKNLI